MRVGGKNKAKVKDLMVNKPMDDKDQSLVSIIEGESCIEPRESKSHWRCSVSISVRLR